MKSFDGEEEAKRQQNGGGGGGASRLDHLEAKAFSSDREDGSGTARGSALVATHVSHA